MTEKEFSKVAVGDIVAHGLTPWARWVVVAKAMEGEIDRGWHVVRVIDNSRIGGIEHHLMSSPREWHLTSKVKKRKKVN